MPLQAGDTVGAYDIVGTLGHGGMATVYQAHHKRLDRDVALKLMHETFLQDDDFRARFQREARIVARLEHPHIVPIYDYNDHNGIPYLVMKFIAGMTLKKYAIKRGLSLQEVHTMLKPIADALDFAHQQGILHRDIKPGNILIDQSDKPYITDFGLARIAEAGASTISHDMMLGTPQYISPEQAQGSKTLDSRTDIYSLAIVLYELVCGRVPFLADTPYAVVHAHIYQPPAPPSTYNSDLSAAVDEMLLTALAKNPDARYPTAAAMLAAFAQSIQEQRPQPAPAPKKTLDFDDLGDDFLKQKPQQRPQPVAPRVPRATPRREIEAKFDLGNLDFSNLGKSIQTGMTSLAEMIEERIDTELRNRRGIRQTEEERIRQRIAKRLKARNEFVKHLSTYLGVNAMLVFIWVFSGAGFFWPIFPLFFWGMGVAGQGYEYYTEYGPGADRRDAIIEEEVRRQMKNKPPQHAAKSKRDRLSIDDIVADNGGVRLNQDGELSDSFIDEQGSKR